MKDKIKNRIIDFFQYGWQSIIDVSESKIDEVFSDLRNEQVEAFSLFSRNLLNGLSTLFPFI